jgi:DNA-binding CsgD family transcriptional regulator
MTDESTPPTQAAGVRAERSARREDRLSRRERCFNLMTSGYSLSQIAKTVQASAATVRREIDRALAERRLDAPDRFAQVQVARLIKALRLAEAAIELGEMKAIATYLRVVAALDRYHELAAGPPPRRPAKAPPLALPTPPRALTFAPCPTTSHPAPRPPRRRRMRSPGDLGATHRAFCSGGSVRCVSSPTRAALARARAQALAGEDQGGGSRRPKQPESSGALFP